MGGSTESEVLEPGQPLPLNVTSFIIDKDMDAYNMRFIQGFRYRYHSALVKRVILV